MLFLKRRQTIEFKMDEKMSEENRKGDNLLKDELDVLRQEIDAIDSQLLGLFEKRMQVVNRVGNLKKSHQEKFFIRSNREADMIKDLLKRVSLFPKSAIMAIWRKIIVAANMHEQPLKIGLCESENLDLCKGLTREYYSSSVPIDVFEDGATAIQALKDDVVKIGVFALPNAVNNADWWVDLAQNMGDGADALKVFARIPFYESDDEVFVAVAAKKAEQSSEDNSLVYIEVADGALESQVLLAFDDAGFSDVRVLKSAVVGDNLAYLLEIDGFYIGDAFKDLVVGSVVKVIGHYALPVQV